VAGWSAHSIEQFDPNRLIRPRAKYTGPGKRTVTPLAQRKWSGLDARSLHRFKVSALI